MAEVILMPRLSDTMTEGVIAAWHKKVGDPVKKGDLLAEIETDKATMELESYQEGTLLHVGAQNGEKLQVNDLLAIIGKPGEDVSALVEQQTGGEAAKSNGAPKQEAHVVRCFIKITLQTAVNKFSSCIQSILCFGVMFFCAGENKAAKENYYYLKR